MRPTPSGIGTRHAELPSHAGLCLGRGVNDCPSGGLYYCGDAFSLFPLHLGCQVSLGFDFVGNCILPCYPTFLPSISPQHALCTEFCPALSTTVESFPTLAASNLSCRRRSYCIPANWHPREWRRSAAPRASLPQYDILDILVLLCMNARRLYNDAQLLRVYPTSS